MSISTVIPMIFILCTMTSLRISFFGIAEMMIVFIFIFLAVSDMVRGDLTVRNYIFSKFWSSQLIVMLVGLSINILFRINANSRPHFDLVSYLFVLISCLTFERLLCFRESQEIWISMEKLYVWGTCVFYALFLIANHKRIIFGHDMYFGGVRFSPFADNPHQFGVLVSVFPIIAYKKMTMEQTVTKKALHILGIFFNVQMGLATRNDTLIVLWLVCLAALTYHYVASKITSGSKRKIFLIVTVCFATALTLLFFGRIADVFYNLFVERDADGARLRIWRYALEAGLRSPLFGLGPGAHSGYYHPFENVEAHNTILQLFTQSGIIGVCLYLSLVCRLFRVIKNDFIVGVCFTAMIVLGLSGSGLRRLALWLYLVTVYYYLRNRNYQAYSDVQNKRN